MTDAADQNREHRGIYSGLFVVSTALLALEVLQAVSVCWDWGQVQRSWQRFRGWTEERPGAWRRGPRRERP
jgi:hypothetical protein